MNLKCLLFGHDWRFAYNHGMPLGITTEEALEMFKSNKTYSVHECRRCHKQARIEGGRYVMLDANDWETP